MKMTSEFITPAPSTFLNFFRNAAGVPCDVLTDLYHGFFQTAARLTKRSLDNPFYIFLLTGAVRKRENDFVRFMSQSFPYDNLANSTTVTVLHAIMTNAWPWGYLNQVIASKTALILSEGPEKAVDNALYILAQAARKGVNLADDLPKIKPFLESIETPQRFNNAASIFESMAGYRTEALLPHQEMLETAIQKMTDQTLPAYVVKDGIESLRKSLELIEDYKKRPKPERIDSFSPLSSYFFFPYGFS
jgi:hypothetical protein